jgi:4-oxalmesaconate hydratase
VPYHCGRFGGLADRLGRPPLDEHPMNNVFFDTCVYHQAGIDDLLRVINIDNILVASEMIGAVRGRSRIRIHWDDTMRYIDAAGAFDADRHKVFESNERWFYPRLRHPESRRVHLDNGPPGVRLVDAG